MRRTSVLRALSLLLGLLLGCAIVELLARLFFDAPPSVHLAEDSGHQRRLAEENDHPRTGRLKSVTLDREGTIYFSTPTGVRLRANTRVVIENNLVSGKTVEVRTNALGYRNPEIGPKRDERVLVLGDSITLEDYLDEDETWVREVEKLSRRSGRPLEVINAGVGGASLASELALFSETGIGTDPDVVLIAWYLNDVQGSPGVWRQAPPGILAYSRAMQIAFDRLSFLQPLAVNEPSQAKINRWYAGLKDLPTSDGDPSTDPRAFNRLILEAFWDWGSAWNEEAWDYMRPLFAEFRQLSEQHGFALKIVAFPVRYQVTAAAPDDWPQRRLKAIGAQLGIPVLDLLPVLRRAQQDSPQSLFLDHCHPGANATEVIGRAILDFLREPSSSPGGSASPAGGAAASRQQP